MSTPNFAVRYMDQTFAGSMIKFNSTDITLNHPMFGEIQLPPMFQVEYADLDIPTIMREKSPNEGWNPITVEKLVQLHMISKD